MKPSAPASLGSICGDYDVEITIFSYASPARHVLPSSILLKNVNIKTISGIKPWKTIEGKVGCMFSENYLMVNQYCCNTQLWVLKQTILGIFTLCWSNDLYRKLFVVPLDNGYLKIFEQSGQKRICTRTITMQVNILKLIFQTVFRAE